MKSTSLLVGLCFLLITSGPKQGYAASPSPKTSALSLSQSAKGDAPFAEVPSPEDSVIYQVNIGAFSSAGNFAGVEARLDSIKALGANVLYLMPIFPIGISKSVNSPYCVRDYEAVNSQFGTMADLQTLVAAAHKRGMAVILDWVADHTSWDNAWIHNKSWYVQDSAGNIISPPHTDWKDVAKLDFHNSEMRSAMIKAMAYWVNHANVDGFRCDAADFIPSDFWLQAIDTLRAIPSHKLLMFAEGTRKDLFTAGFQLKYGTAFYENLVDNIYGKKGSVRSIDPINVGEYLNATCDDRAVRFVTNHDLDMAGTPLELLDGKDGSLAAFVVAAYMKGVPMIYDGQEVGCPIRLNFLAKNGVIDWSQNPDLAKQYQKILEVRNQSVAIRRGDLESFSTDDVCAFTKIYKTEKVFVMANLRNAAESLTVSPELIGTTWTDAINGGNVTLTGQVSLHPFQYEILQAEDKNLLVQAMNTTASVSGAAAPSAGSAPGASLSIPGDYEGWDPAKAAVLNSSPGTLERFEGYLNLNGPDTHYFKLTSAPDWTHMNYGDGGSGALSTAAKTPAMSVPDGGYYELTADLKKNTWTATKTTWSIIGDCTPGNWQTDTPMTYDPAKQVWMVTVKLTTAGSFKFRANDAWVIDFGIDDGGNLQYADNPFYPYNSTLKNLTVAADGMYMVVLDLHVSNKYTYAIVPKND